jgi:hypothetical protein
VMSALPSTAMPGVKVKVARRANPDSHHHRRHRAAQREPPPPRLEPPRGQSRARLQRAQSLVQLGGGGFIQLKVFAVTMLTEPNLRPGHTLYYMRVFRILSALRSQAVLLQRPTSHDLNATERYNESSA